MIASKLNQIYSDINYIIEKLPPLLVEARNLADQNGDVNNSASSPILTESNSSDDYLIEKNFEQKEQLVHRALMLRSLVKLSNLKKKIFDENQFHDPVWEMFIELALASSTGRQLSVTSLSLASNAPASTAVRYIDIMVQKGMFEKVVDRNDRRRTFVRLTEKGAEKMNAYAQYVEQELIGLSKIGLFDDAPIAVKSPTA
jgi:DNA-binding MarR family transcriptional regulator